ncbi:DUF3592 domain-containing protein [Ruminococcus sp. Marseille-P6503]|uniref:DUF3592 domain-containing protein n=1 Tax=Ruminococcus sp. Marseille-P6503 TaxID=2364796 RepID=UPI000F529957|nr:DUF3592 domain-containing protein [Ruminococcus sp. Marseille-P6503]
MVMRKNRRGIISSAALLPAIFLIVGVVFLCVGIGVRFYEQDKKESCTVRTYAKVVDIVSKTDSDGTVYAPVFSYEVNGQEYVKQRNSYSNPCNYYKGQSLSLYINPNDPEEFYDGGDNVYKILFYIFGGMGALFTVIAVVTIVFNIKMRKKQDGLEQPDLYVETDDTEYYNDFR